MLWLLLLRSSLQDRVRKELRRQRRQQLGRSRSDSDTTSTTDTSDGGLGDLSAAASSSSSAAAAARTGSATASSSSSSSSSAAAHDHSEKSLVKALLSSDDIRGAFDHDKVRGTASAPSCCVRVCCTRCLPVFGDCARSGRDVLLVSKHASANAACSTTVCPYGRVYY
jgi:hypothetical protein